MKDKIDFIITGLIFLGLAIPFALIFLLVFWLLNKVLSVGVTAFICLLVSSAISMLTGILFMAGWALLHPQKAINKIVDISTSHMETENKDDSSKD